MTTDQHSTACPSNELVSFVGTKAAAPPSRLAALQVRALKHRFPRWRCEDALSAQREAILTIMRDRRTSKEEFVFYADRLFRLLIEDALNELPFESCLLQTPSSDQFFEGVKFSSSICGVSIVRAGESMEAGLRAVCRGCRIGKILIQRDPETHLPTLIYENLPRDIANKNVLLMDPMVGTGGTMCIAVEVLTQKYKVPQNKIIICNLVCVEEGLSRVFEKYPNVKIVSCICDPLLCPITGYIVPGVGDFGDRYFGTH